MPDYVCRVVLYKCCQQMVDIVGFDEHRKHKRVCLIAMNLLEKLTHIYELNDENRREISMILGTLGSTTGATAYAIYSALLSMDCHQDRFLLAVETKNLFEDTLDRLSSLNKHHRMRKFKHEIACISDVNLVMESAFGLA